MSQEIQQPLVTLPSMQISHHKRTELDRSRDSKEEFASVNISYDIRNMIISNLNLNSQLLLGSSVSQDDKFNQASSNEALVQILMNQPVCWSGPRTELDGLLLTPDKKAKLTEKKIKKPVRKVKAPVRNIKSSVKAVEIIKKVELGRKRIKKSDSNYNATQSVSILAPGECYETSSTTAENSQLQLNSDSRTNVTTLTKEQMLFQVGLRPTQQFVPSVESKRRIRDQASVNHSRLELNERQMWLVKVNGFGPKSNGETSVGQSNVHKNGSAQIFYKMRDVKKFFDQKERRSSQVVYISKGDNNEVFRFNITIIPGWFKTNEKPKDFGYYIACNNENGKVQWKCATEIEFRLINQLPDGKNKLWKSRFTFHESREMYGVKNFATYREITNLSKGFFVNDMIIFQTTINLL